MINNNSNPINNEDGSNGPAPSAANPQSSAAQTPGGTMGRIDWHSLSAVDKERLRQHILGSKNPQLISQFMLMANSNARDSTAGLHSSRAGSGLFMRPPGAPPVVRPPLSTQSAPMGHPPMPRPPPPKYVNATGLTEALRSVPPFSPDLPDDALLHSMTAFYACIGVKFAALPPVIGNQRVSVPHFFKVAMAFGGLHSIDAANRWPAVLASCQVPLTAEWVHSMRQLYITLLLPYEQFFVHRLPVESIRSFAERLPEQRPQAPSPNLQHSQPSQPSQPSQHPQHPQHSQHPQHPQGQTKSAAALPKNAPQAAATPEANLIAMRALSKALRFQTLYLDIPPLRLHDLVCQLRAPPLQITGDTLPVGHVEALNRIQAIVHCGRVGLSEPAMAKVVDALLDYLERLPGAARTEDDCAVRETSAFFEGWRRVVRDGPSKDVFTLAREQISNTFRAYSFATPHNALARSVRFYREYLLPAIVAGGSSIECYRNAWIMLDNLLLHMPHAIPGLLQTLVPTVTAELAWLAPQLRSRGVKLFLPAAMNDDPKQGILQTSSVLSNISRFCPPYVSCQLSCMAKLCYAARHHRGTVDARPAFVQALIDFVRLLVPHVTNLCHFMHRELQQTRDLTPWLRGVTYNAHYSFPDCGYLEMALTVLWYLMPNAENASLTRRVFLPELLSLTQAVLHWWIHPRPPIEVSPDGRPCDPHALMQQLLSIRISPATDSSKMLILKTSESEFLPAPHSHPLQVLLRCLQLLTATFLVSDGMDGDAENAMFFMECIVERWHQADHLSLSTELGTLFGTLLERCLAFIDPQ